jgi:hypothetical protein
MSANTLKESPIAGMRALLSVRPIVIGAIASVLALALSTTARAATITVNSLADPGAAGICALRDAITAANTKTATNGCAAGTVGGSDTINFSVTGTITLSSTSGALPTVTNTLTINGPASPGITISGGGVEQVMQVAAGATLNLNNLMIADGVSGRGGGIFNSGTLIVTNITFSGNSAVGGGAIENVGTLTVTNSTFSKNSATDGSGGGISNLGTLTVTNSTFSGNGAADIGGAIENLKGAISSVKNTILAASTGGNCAGTITDAGFNISDDNACAFSATGSRNSTNPELDPAGLADNGGPTQTIALLVGSPAIDAIPLALCTDQAGTPLTTDQRGFARPDAGENACDIGAYEFQDATPTPTVTVTPTITPTPTVTVTPTITPTPTVTPTPIITPTPTVGAMVVMPALPITTLAGPGATVSSGTFTLQNTGGTALITQVVTISFNNADLFTSATITATVGPNTSTATVNPKAGGNSPEQPNDTAFLLQPPLVVPPGQTATLSLAVTVTANPQISKRDGPVMYAAMVAGGTTGSTEFLIALLLMELCAVGIGTTRRRRVLIALLLLLALVSPVGCNNSSSGPGTASGVVQSTQTATQVEAMPQANNDPAVVTGLPAVMGTVSVGVM